MTGEREQVDESQPGGAVRAARTNDFTQGVGWGGLEALQGWDAPLLKSGRWVEMLARCLRALCLIAPFGGLLLPLGNPGGPDQSIMESDGFAGDQLRGMAQIVFTLGAIGQVWTLVEWVRWGRHRGGIWTACSVLAVICSGLSLWWFRSLLPPNSYEGVLLPIGATLVLGAVAVALMLCWSRPGDLHAVQMEANAETMRRLPQADQQTLLDERREVVAVLLERGKVTQEQADEALAMPLGDWYLLDREPDEPSA
ncbi:hypothetical protein [Janibacter anophelis]|uniref:hypothetical protein n=1 Tax=Janibacter anophelis TaxID=319054 RepID=UPI000DEF8669|nr:hypothetical protein [Janibacter anophelis]